MAGIAATSAPSLSNGGLGKGRALFSDASPTSDRRVASLFRFATVQKTTNTCETPTQHPRNVGLRPRKLLNLPIPPRGWAIRLDLPLSNSKIRSSWFQGGRRLGLRLAFGA